MGLYVVQNSFYGGDWIMFPCNRQQAVRVFASLSRIPVMGTASIHLSRPVVQGSMEVAKSTTVFGRAYRS